MRSKNYYKCTLVYLTCILYSSSIYSLSDVEDVIINPKLKEKILDSSLNANLETDDRKKIRAYIYAEDEKRELRYRYSCLTGAKIYELNKTGHFYIYLYDVGSQNFIGKRTKVFDGREITLNIEGADIIVLSNHKKNKSDVLLVSVFGDCRGNFFEAYGFSENNSYLKNYFFQGKHKDQEFYGRIDPNNGNPRLTAYGMYDSSIYRLTPISLYLSKNRKEIMLKQEPEICCTKKA